MRNLFLVAVIFFLSLQCSAQVSSIGFTSVTYSSPAFPADTPGQTHTIYDSIYNIGNQAVVGEVYFYAKTPTVNSVVFDSVSTTLDTFGSPKPVSLKIPVADSILNLNTGPNLIVVWPVYQSRPALDSLHATINLTHALGIEDAPIFKIYLTQYGSLLNIQFGDAQNLVKQVSLYNMQGQRIYDGTAHQSQHIPTDSWSQGIYFCEINTYKGERRTIKFALQ